MIRRIFTFLEFVILFFGIPILFYLDQEFVHLGMFILPVLGFIFIILRYTTDFRFRELITWKIPTIVLIRNIFISLIALILMLSYVLLFERENLFNLLKANPLMFIAMCIFYPVFSAFGQEIIYRTFIFRRYSRIFPKDWQFVLASAITFSFLHIIYYNPVSIFLTFIGGVYLAKVYLQTRSVLFTATLHGLLGIMAFGVGLGQYFWLDMPV